MNKPVIAFIGAGNMATSLIGGLINDNYPNDNIWVSNPNPEKLAQFASTYGVSTTTSNLEAAQEANVILLAVKPQVMQQICPEIKDIIQQKCPLVISIAAGISTSTLENYFGTQAPLVRCMPNTPALVRSGITGLYAPAHVTDEQRNQAESILRAVGVTEWLLHESQLDTVTAISGSGPAYFFYLMEILQQEAENLGLNHKSARLFSVQTALGAARLALESNEDPAVLRQQVTSPNGTTAAAIEILMDGDMHQLFAKAIKAAQQRSVEMGKLNQ